MAEPDRVAAVTAGHYRARLAAYHSALVALEEEGSQELAEDFRRALIKRAERGILRLTEQLASLPHSGA